MSTLKISDDLKKLILSLSYPVGSVFQTTSNDLNTVAKVQAYFGGTWEQISGRFLLAWGDNPGTTGGSFQSNDSSAANTGSTTLTTDQIPAHTHGSKSITGWFEMRKSTGNANEIQTSDGTVFKIASTSNSSTTITNSSTNYNRERINFDASHEHSSVGGGQGHTHNMQHSHYHEPPWYKVYCFRRIA